MQRLRDEIILYILTSLPMPTDTSKALAEIFPYAVVDQLCVQGCIPLISLYSDIHSPRLPDYHHHDHCSRVP
jgi:hypothetical protein